MNNCSCQDCVQFGLSKHPDTLTLKEREYHYLIAMREFPFKQIPIDLDVYESLIEQKLIEEPRGRMVLTQKGIDRISEGME